MSAKQEREALRRIAASLEEDVSAVAAVLLGHAWKRDPEQNRASWLCECGYVPGLGQMHARHQAVEVLELLNVRRRK